MRPLISLLIACATAFAAPALLTHTHAGGTLPLTTSGIDTTGATLLVVTLNGYGFSSPASTTVSDSKGNTWIALTPETDSPGTTVVNTVMFYAWAALNTGSGHTVTLSATNNFVGATFSAFGGTKVSANPLGATQNGALTLSSVTTLQAGSITPSQDGALIIANLGTGDGSASFTIDSGFSVIDQVAWVSGSNESNASAYLIQTHAAAVNGLVPIFETNS